MGIRKVERKKAKNGYVYEVNVSYTDCYGISRRVWETGFLTQKEAKAYEAQVRYEIRQKGFFQKECKKTFNEVYEEYMETEGRLTHARDTLVYYENTMKNHIQNSIGKMKICFIHYKPLQDYFNQLEKNISHPTAINAKKVLSVVFQYALKCEYIQVNPLTNVKLIPVKKEVEEKKKSLTNEEFNSLIKTFSSKDSYTSRVTDFTIKSYVVALYIGRYCGLRVSEAFALEKKDFDFENETIDLCRSLVYKKLARKDFYVKNELKTKTSKCKIVFPKPLQKILKVWFEENPHEIVICQEDGFYMSPMTFNYHARRLSKSLGFDFHYHMLRHSLATELAQSGVNPAIAMSMLRHSEIKTTMQIYTHPDLENQRKAIQQTFKDTPEEVMILSKSR